MRGIPKEKVEKALCYLNYLGGRYASDNETIVNSKNDTVLNA